VRQHGEPDDRRANSGHTGPDHETHGPRVSPVGSRAEQNDRDGGEVDRHSAARPGGNDPEQRDDTNRDECTRGIDQSRQPVRHVQTDDIAAARDWSSRISDKQSQPVRCM
jgi:hypothetical protein